MSVRVKDRGGEKVNVNVVLSSKKSVALPLPVKHLNSPSEKIPDALKSLGSVELIKGACWLCHIPISIDAATSQKSTKSNRILSYPNRPFIKLSASELTSLNITSNSKPIHDYTD